MWKTPRLAMKLFPVHSIFWPCLLVLWTSQSETEANYPDVCEEDMYIDKLNQLTSSGHEIERAAVDDNFLCVLYPTNILNCSWSLQTLQQETQLLVYISLCDNMSTVYYHSSEERARSWSLLLPEYEELYVVLYFNVTLHDKWTVYTYIYDMDMLEVLPPPQNISASFNDGDLLVTWAPPHTRQYINLQCFEFQLDLGDWETVKNLTNQLSYTEPMADPSRTYSVRMRTKSGSNCLGSPQWSEWSEWSHPVTMEKSVYKLNTLVMISISLGIPMILLAVLLLVRHQRVSKVLFPPIPCPPSKYKYFLERNDTSNLFRPALSAEPEAEITEVEDAEQNLGGDPRSMGSLLTSALYVVKTKDVS